MLRRVRYNAAGGAKAGHGSGKLGFLIARPVRGGGARSSGAGGSRRSGLACQASSTGSEDLQKKLMGVFEAKLAAAARELEEEMARLVEEEAAAAEAAEPALSEQVRGSFSLKKKEFAPKEWPKPTEAAAPQAPQAGEGASSSSSLELARLELEVEKLQLQTMKQDVLEEKIRAVELSASAREKELLMIIAEKERGMAALEQLVKEQEEFVAEVRRVEVQRAMEDVGESSAGASGDAGEVAELESRWMAAQASLAEVAAEKAQLERRVADLEAGKAEDGAAAGDAVDPLLAQVQSMSLAAKASEESGRLLQEKEEVIQSLQRRLEEQESSATAKLREVEIASASAPSSSEVEVAAAMRDEEKINAQVARIRQLEIEMSQMMTQEEILQELEQQQQQQQQLAEIDQALASKKKADSVSGSAAAPAAAISPSSAVPPPSVVGVEPSGGKLSNGHGKNGLKTAGGGLFQRTSKGSFVLKKKYFTPKAIKPAGGAEAGGPKRPTGGSFQLRRKEFAPKQWPRGDAAAAAGAMAAGAGSFRQHFSLRKKVFAPKQWPRSATGAGEDMSFARKPAGSFVLNSKRFAPKQLPRLPAQASDDYTFYSETKLKASDKAKGKRNNTKKK